MSAPEAVFYLRNPETVVISRQHEIIALHSGGKMVCLRSTNQDTDRVLASLREPRELNGIVSDTGLPMGRVKSILSAYLEQRVVLCGTLKGVKAAIPVRIPSGRKFLCKNLVIGVSGTIQTATIVSLMVTLKAQVAEEVDVILTTSALRFIRPEVISYFGIRAWSDTFEVRGETNVPHIALATRADIVLIAPASAHTIHRLASGSCSDLLSLTVAATRAPVVVVPAMNSAMLACRAVERNIERLKSDGFYVVEPGLGFEVSNTSDGNFSFCGAAANERNVAMVLRAVLNLAARKAHSLRPEAMSNELTTVEEERTEESVEHLAERFEVEQGFDKAV